jgi:MFS transporter, DHA2 family, glioxin efflux transporter
MSSSKSPTYNILTSHRAFVEKVSVRKKILQMDLPGAALILAAVVCYILAVQDAGISKAWNSSQVIGLLVGFVLILIAFAVVEYLQKDRALLEGRLMQDRTTIIACAFLAS